MNALIIKPTEQSVEVIDVTCLEDIIKLIGYETIIADDVGNNGDKLYFDEDCFLRGTEGRFQVDTLVPVSGNGVIIGADESGALTDAHLNLEEAKPRVKFL
jgi:hypothetical protein